MAEWQAGADQHLRPGETEVVTVTLALPLAAGNECQGATGRLLIRQGLVEQAEKRGVYECHPFPIYASGQGVEDPVDALGGCYCWDVSRPLHRLLGHP